MSIDEVHAMQFIQPFVWEISTRDNDDKATYLPPNRGMRSSYYCYCSSFSYKESHAQTGNIQLMWQGLSNDQQNQPVVLSTPDMRS